LLAGAARAALRAAAIHVRLTRIERAVLARSRHAAAAFADTRGAIAVAHAAKPFPAFAARGAAAIHVGLVAVFQRVVALGFTTSALRADEAEAILVEATIAAGRATRGRAGLAAIDVRLAAVAHAVAAAGRGACAAHAHAARAIPRHDAGLPRDARWTAAAAIDIALVVILDAVRARERRIACARELIIREGAARAASDRHQNRGDGPAEQARCSWTRVVHGVGQRRNLSKNKVKRLFIERAEHSKPLGKVRVFIAIFRTRAIALAAFDASTLGLATKAGA